MERSPPWPRQRLIALGILAVGWTIALVVYLTAAPPVEYPEIDDLEHTKSYLRQMEVIGGKAAVAGNQLNEWVASLWHGERLAYTIATLTAAVVLVYHWWTSTSPPEHVE